MWNVPTELLENYVSCVQRMRAFCRPELSKAFELAHQARAKAHDEVLSAAGVSRDDQSFGFWLANFVEDAITAREEADELRQNADKDRTHS